MTNLEANKEIIREGMALCIIAYLCKYGGVCEHKKCRDCEFNENVYECIKEVLSEHKEPIKLTEFERDVLKAFTKLLNYEEGDRIEDFSALQALWNGGWFRNIDENLSIQEILENCEVVE